MVKTVNGRKILTATIALTMEQKLARSAHTFTKFQLFSALGGGDRRVNGQWINGGNIQINGIDCILSGIQREDGSGSSFILTVYGPDNMLYRCYTRTSDGKATDSKPCSNSCCRV